MSRNDSEQRRVASTPSRSTGGAVYIEFLVAFFPLFVFFLGLVQLADLHQANIIVHHAAMMAVRSAIVILPDDPQFYDGVEVGSATGKRREDIVKATTMVLMASRSISEMKLSFPSTTGGDDDQEQVGRNDLVHVKLQARYQCRVPFVNRLVCSQNSLRTITAEAAMPNQGADYKY